MTYFKRKIIKFVLYLNTIKYLKIKQITYRLKKLITQPKLKNKNLTYKVAHQSGAWIETPAGNSSMISPTAFCFLNTCGDLKNIGWAAKNRSKLWCYNLHYFDDLVAFDFRNRYQIHHDLIINWIEECSNLKAVAWEPYPTSLRIVNWIKWTLITNTNSKIVFDSLIMQAQYLRANIEWHVMGNHLIANAKALIFAGSFFDGLEPSECISTGKKLLINQIRSQVLGDGGHFERSPMYHCIILEDLIDILNIAKSYPNKFHINFISELELTIRRMLSWLSEMIHPDGDICLFNDATFSVGKRYIDLLDYANKFQNISISTNNKKTKLGLKNLFNSGYVRITSDDIHIWMNIGAISPNYQPGHAHADSLSIEMSYRGQRLFVNGGVSTYEEGPQRDYERSTKAHNTVEINNKNCTEVWGAFRVGRRVRVNNYEFRQDDEKIIVTCGRKDYSNWLGSSIVKRSCELYRDKVIISDRVSNSTNSAVSRFQLHPLFRIYATNNSKIWKVHHITNDYAFDMEIIGGEAALVQSTFSSGFGKVEQIDALAVTFCSAEIYVKMFNFK